MNAEDPAVQGWQAATEEAESRLSTSARARRQAGELAEVRSSADRAFQAVEELSAELAAAVRKLADVRAAAERNVERLAHVRRELASARHDAEHCAAERDQALAEVERLRAQQTIGSPVNKIEGYAAKLVAEGGEATAEDDLDEGEEFEESEEGQWREATELGVKMAQAIGRNRESFVAWYRSVESDG